MKAGRVPVIISDQWVPPVGPLWKTFSIRVNEREIDRIPGLLEDYEPQAQAIAMAARAAWEEWFSIEAVFHRIVEWCLELRQRSATRPVNHLIPYVHLLRPFYFRHVVLTGIKRSAYSRLGGLQRFLSARIF
jgi:hypothetical protein